MEKKYWETSIAKVTVNGVFFNNHFYTNSLLIREKWFEAGSVSGGWYVEVTYTEFRADFIYIKLNSNFTKLLVISPVEITQEEKELYFLEMEKLKIEYKKLKYQRRKQRTGKPKWKIDARKKY
ncbi:hypothetical protein EV294_102678 [Paenibacillus sp. BK033]|uniref:hypothetical protein n=1 Tax=Paenibacillus sp. BK033 TaxID=2512133 RepID=UPI0010522AF8|nr:hypothetical protein [Paenibacillus sp. BK033]TCM99382.1 hypothetical protein EV294_102678 [Paenibacillus sp. BK033]